MIKYRGPRMDGRRSFSYIFFLAEPGNQSPGPQTSPAEYECKMRDMKCSTTSITARSIELGDALGQRLLRVPRKFCFVLHKDLTVRVLGGYSLPSSALTRVSSFRKPGRCIAASKGWE